MGPITKSVSCRRSAVALVSLALSTGCFADVEAADPGPDDDDSETSGATSGGPSTTGTANTGTGSGSGASTDGADGSTSTSTSAFTTSGSTAEASTVGSTGEGTLGSSDASGSSETAAEAETDTESTALWNESCGLTPAAPACSKTTLGSLPVFCTMPVLQTDGLGICGRSSWSRVQLDLPAGEFVIGSTNLLDAEFSVVDSRGVLSMCGGVFGSQPINAPAQVAIDVRSDVGGAAPGLVVRERDSLCPISAVDCCVGSNLPAATQCEDDGLRGCVEALDPVCTNMWDSVCVAEATLVCGADCLAE